MAAAPKRSAIKLEATVTTSTQKLEHALSSRTEHMQTMLEGYTVGLADALGSADYVAREVIKQEDIVIDGHAIECRIYAEDPEQNFLPSPGRMNLYHEPSGQYIRVDTGIAGNPVIQSNFDP
ncbi:MAG: hypothetical protein HGB14_10755, partial [Anaerolineaceae bacterium]|nr:hypothetical protein [Anaerolineaceae bacterium]